MELTKIAPPPEGSKNSLSRQAELLRESLSSALKIVDQMSGVPIVRVSDHEISEREVRALIRLRRNRDRFFDAEIFADPAWDILLELYAAELGQLRVSVTSLCAAAAVPPTTALRWINQLEERRLISRRPDPTDARRHFIELTYKGIEGMNAYFRTIPGGAPLI